METKELQKILKQHFKYLKGQAGGARANLRGADLPYANLDGADLREATLLGADLLGASLRYANLQGADLQGADLRGANLRNADLEGAKMRGANLLGADLRGAYGYVKELMQPLIFLFDQPGAIIAYKLINNLGEGAHYGGIKYVQGKTYEVLEANTDPHVLCGAGINVATLGWCLNNWCLGDSLIKIEFTSKDIACIPTTSDGKLRLFRGKVVGTKAVPKQLIENRKRQVM